MRGVIGIIMSRGEGRKKRMSKSFSYSLLQKGLLKRDQFILVLSSLQKDAAMFEKIAVKKGLLSKQDAEEILKIVILDSKDFTTVSVELGFLTKDERNIIINAQMDDADYLCDVIERLDMMPSKRLHEELEKFKALDKSDGKLAIDTKEILQSLDESAFSHRKFLDSLLKTTAKQFKQIMNVSADFGEIAASISSIDNLHYLIMVEVDSGLNMVLFLSIDEAIARGIVENMIKSIGTIDILDFETKQIVYIDCFKEFFNIICGHTRARLLDANIDIAISAPEVERITGKSKIGLGESSVAIFSRLRTREGSAMLGFIKRGVAFQLL